MNIDQVSRDLVSKHWGAVDFDKLIAAEMRKLQEETLDEAARECDGKALSADAAAADFDQSIDIILEHKDRARSARALAKRIRSLKKHPPTQPDAQTEQPMHMQNGLTLEQREWIRAEIACALESRPAAPTSKADEMLRAVVEAASGANRSLFNEDSWSTSVYRRYSRALSAAREYVQNKAGTDARESSSGEAGSMDVPIKPRSTTAADTPQDGATASVPAPSSSAETGRTSGTQEPDREVGGAASRPVPVMSDEEAEKVYAPPPTTGEREVPADDAGWPAWFPTFEELNTAARKAHMDRRIGVPSNVAIIDAVAGLIAQRSPLSPEAKGEGTVRDLVRKIDELRERALRERSNTALLDFRAATFDAWPTIRAALTGGAL